MVNGLVTTDPERDHFEIYLISFMVATLQFSGGMGTIFPENLGEYCLYFSSTLFGTSMLAVFVGVIASLATNSDPNEAAYNHQLDALNYFLTDLSIQPRVRVRAREFLSNARHLIKKNAYNRLVDFFSPQVRSVSHTILCLVVGAQRCSTQNPNVRAP
eukprot:7384357-Prymnesium_polylepis.2